VKYLSFIVALLFSFKGYAAEELLVPVFTPKPEYPKDLIKTRYTGKVRVYLTVGASGTIQGARVIESSHPDLTAAVQRALVQWRFEPREVAGGDPNYLEFTVLVLFGARGVAPFSREITVGLNDMLCAYLNYEVKASKRDFPKEPLSKVDVFSYTAEFLGGSYVTTKVPDVEQRKTLFKLLGSSIPQVVSACRRYPDSKYATHLPKEIRELLVDVKPGEGAKK
jgi:TonB family protein